MGINFFLVQVVKPLVGEGLILEANHFEDYSQGLIVFWEELIERLVPIFVQH